MDAIERIEKATQQASKAVNAVKPDQLGDPTPCSEFDVRGLLNHLIGGLGMLTTAASGGKAVTPDSDLVGDGSDVGSRYDAGRTKLLEAIRADGVLERTWEMPFGALPGQVMASIAFMEHVTHAWDVAKATGQDTTLPTELAQECLDVVTPMDAMLRTPGVCGPPVAVPDDASLTDRLVAFMGRQP
jgi:uncharacterized protein (TIGR03086 family)